ncbi:hypothetical protein V496_02867 [Pseudogymnoascus sp. VKM F-4515 (FW-2607)]|nr:hypothetical protein V496_02867 [Pseudogymnoascus sp. VKM F-4515 (FW-2607)]
MRGLWLTKCTPPSNINHSYSICSSAAYHFKSSTLVLKHNTSTMKDSIEEGTTPEYSTLLADEDELSLPGDNFQRPKRWWKSKLQIFLMTSLAHLVAESPLPWLAKDVYLDEDPKMADQAWDDININMGTVALDKSYAASMKLPESQGFPWDESKSVYLLAGFHDLHCLKTIREWIAQKDRGGTPSEPVEHMFHCLDALRQDIQCYADDTPRYTDHSHLSGIGQDRPRGSYSAKAEERSGDIFFSQSLSVATPALLQDD